MTGRTHELVSDNQHAQAQSIISAPKHCEPEQCIIEDVLEVAQGEPDEDAVYRLVSPS